MTTLQEADVQSIAGVRKDAGCLLVIAVPFYRNERLVEPFMASLAACAEEIRDLTARVILFDDSPDYPALGEALDRAVQAHASDLPVVVRRNASNLGWLKTCNVAMQEADSAGADVLLFNSDTVIFPGAIREMLRVAQLDPMIGFVNPRSNHATLATFPVGDAPSSPLADCHARFLAASRTLPELSYVPTAVGFAILIRRRILKEFGYFDEAYGGGYNEENDLVMRASRSGYRAALANRAYVWHDGSASLGATETSNKDAVDASNRQLLLRRYPEYQRLVDAWFGRAEHIAEKLISATLPRASGKLAVAFDLSGWGAYHSGTHKAGLQLLKHSARIRERFEVHAICSPEAYDFHDISSTGIERADPAGDEIYAAIIRLGQPFQWDPVRRMSEKAAVTGVYMLDTIALDCGHLYNPAVFDLWQHIIDQSDFIIYNSEFTARQFELRFLNTQKRPSSVSLHSVSADDYLLPEGEPSPSIAAIEPGYVLIVGNQYPHKAVADTASRIAQALPNRRVVAMGLTKEDLKQSGMPGGEPSPLGPASNKLVDAPNLQGLLVGQLTDADMTALQRKADLIVMPSHYEGFGLPVLSALALKRPIFTRRLPPLMEIHDRLHRNPNLHFFDSISELIGMIEARPVWKNNAENATPRHDGERAAADVLSILETCIAHASYGAIVTRLRSIHTLLTAPITLTIPTSLSRATHAESAAYRFGRAAERLSAPLFKLPIVYGLTRLLYRIVRPRKGRSDS